MKLDSSAFRGDFTGYGRSESSNNVECTDCYICRTLSPSRIILIASSKTAGPPNPEIAVGLRESLGTGLLSDSPPVVLAGEGFERSVRARKSLHRWPFFSILLWSLITGAVLSAFAGLLGCRACRSLPETIGNDTACVDAIMANVDAGAPPSQPAEVIALTTAPLPPITIRDAASLQNATYRDLTLRETILIALTNSEVLRDLNATVLRAPEQVSTQQSLPLVQTDPQMGIEAALSAFDAQLYAMGNWENNDRQFNNRFFGGGANAFQQDLHDYVLQSSKRTATGAQLALRSITDYDANNATGNLVPSAWQSQFEAEIRQPLLRGGGLTFNRIAGAAALPGVYNGVLIAKANNDMSVAEFRRNTRNDISNVINAY